MQRVRQRISCVIFPVALILTFAAVLTAAELIHADTWTYTSATMNTHRHLHAAIRLLDGKVLLAGGSNNGFAMPSQLYDPVNGSWLPVGTPVVDRGLHGSTLLADGRVLVTGGNHVSLGTLASAEIFNPATNAWSAAASMSNRRLAHTATRLLDGRILVAGGYVYDTPGDRFIPLSSAELYDPATNTWSAARPMNNRRGAHTATTLLDGRILIVGGDGGTNTSSLKTTEVYNPTTNSWVSAASLSNGRAWHTATTLADGRVLLTGGQDWDSGLRVFTFVSSSEVYNSAPGNWTPGGPMIQARAAHTATLLPDGQVMVAGGDGGGYSLFSVERYNPITNSWTSVAPLNTTRAFHTASLLANGRILVAGGYGGGIGQGAVSSLLSAEVYDSAPNNKWTLAAPMSASRSFHTSTKLSDGRVLVAGGDDGVETLSSVEIYQPLNNVWMSAGDLANSRANHTATLLGDGRVLVVGGVSNSDTILLTAEIFDPESSSWSLAAAMAQPRAFHTATLLLDGRVMVAGGFDGTNNLGTVEIYNPVTNNWISATPMGTQRSFHGAGMLSGRSFGQVLVFGGSDGANVLSTVEIYNPTADLWSPAGSMHSNRIFFAASLLNAEIFVIGGRDQFGNFFSTTERFLPPRIGVWLGAGSMSMPRTFHTATQLTDGQVLVVGGTMNFNGEALTLPFAQVYDPAPLVESWSTVASMNSPRIFHTSTLLTDGRVLITGGSTDGSTSLSSVEIYPAIQKINFDTIFSFVTFAHPPITLSASASSGLPVAFTAAGNCSVSGSILTIQQVGSCSVTASQSGNSVFNPAPQVTRTFQIGKAFPGIVITAGTFSYDGNPHGATAFAHGIGGIADLLSPPVTITYQGVGYGPTTTPPTNVGNYSATATFAGNDLYINWSDSAGLTINSFGMPPETTITDAPITSVPVNSLTFIWTGTDDQTPTAGLTYAYRLDPLEPSFSTFGSAVVKTYANLPNGFYTFYVKARDLSGNEDPTPAFRSINVLALPGAVPVVCFSESLQAAVDAAQPGQILSVAGTCNENVLISNAKERITIEGVGQAAINGTNPATPTINLRGKGVAIQGLTITGGSNGIRVNRGSSAVLSRNYIHRTGGSGIAIEELSYAIVTASTIENNPDAGVLVSEKSAARIGFNSDLEIIPSNNFIQNNGVGIVIADSSSARIVGNTINFNSGDGIVVLRGSQADISNNNIAANGGDGIEVAENSMVDLGEDSGDTMYDRPNWTFGNNLGFGVKCTTAGIVEGRRGILSGTSGASSFDGTCINGLVP